MPSDYDSTEFVDDDFDPSGKGSHGVTPFPLPASPAAAAHRPPSREEVDSRMSQTQQKLAELKRVQEELERERSTLEETRRRQSEYTTGRKEALEQITRAVGLLTEAEFARRQDAEQMARALEGLRAALEKVESTGEQGWTRENFAVELTRALTVLENARMELNSAKLKFPLLTGQGSSAEPGSRAVSSKAVLPDVSQLGLGRLCQIGLALTWPLALVALIVGMLLVMVGRR